MSNDADAAGLTASVDQRDDRETGKGYRRVLLSSFLGTSVEYYDFLLYGTAASLVFGPLFFKGQGQAIALLLSFATFAVGYIARPLGGIIFGTIGDRLGRKASLFTTMLMMGIASTAIGVLPTSSQVGAIAPILLVIVRVIQGIAVGGEWGGAALMALEHSPDRKRGFGASFANMGGPAGGFVATIMFALFSALPREQFLSWGWRIPFLFSAVLVAVGLFVRLKIAESPVFVAAKKRTATGEKPRPAILVVISRYPRQLALAATAVIGALVFQTFFSSFALTMSTNGGVSSSAVLYCKAGSQVVNLISIGYFAHFSDRLGRKRVLMGGACASILAAYPILMLMGSGSVVGVLLGYTLGNVVQGAMYGPLAAYISELFGTGARYTGAGVSYQLGAIIGGFTPFIATSLWELGQHHVSSAGWSQYWLIGLFLILGCVVTIVSVSVGKETRNRKLDQAESLA
ncbi:MFS transporter [Amycolatopsis taiwanensis]|uniref:MFS transporter n=1 Tax=Amycolatopsis taiwanensis TaxID=342230 RepID=UPI00047F5A1D|nr:MFS transporter [Amycolatopsis taiwanensis]